MAQVSVELTIHPKWWFKPAVVIAVLAVEFGLIRDADSAEHWGGRITAWERASKWLADYAFRVECP